MPDKQTPEQEKRENISKIHYRQFNVIGKSNSKKDDTKKDDSPKTDTGDVPVFLLKDFNFANRKYISKGDLTTADYRYTVPKIIIDEYQPDLIFNWNQKWKKFRNQWVGAGTTLMTVGKNIFSSIDDAIKRLTSSKTETQSADKNKSKTNSAITKLFIEKDESKYKEQVLTQPLQLYRDFFDGKFIAKYEMPLNDDYYMKADGKSGWNLTTELASAIDLLNKTQKYLSNNIPLEIPIVPEWNNKNEDFIELTNTFILYNNNFENLRKNFFYVNALVSGAHWIQVDFKQFSPNVYRVVIPGFVKLIYAAMKVEVVNVGNRRRLPDILVDRFNTGTSVNITSDTMFADAWKVTVSFRSLVPNNYNTFIDGLLQSDQKIDVVRVATNDQRLQERTASALKNVNQNNGPKNRAK